MKKVLKPFWSYSILKTEGWLEEMAGKGYHLTKVNRFTRIFTFERREPKSITYQIGYEKNPHYELPNALKNDGWLNVYQNHSWYVISNPKLKTDIKTSSAREGIIKHNRIMYYIHFGIVLYFLWLFLVNSSLFFIGMQDITIVESPLWVITYIASAIAFLMFISSIYSLYKIPQSNNELVKENFANQAFENDLPKYPPFEIEEEIKLKKTKQLVKKRKFLWMQQPDKLETWLEKMEKNGFNLIYVGSRGITFYFMKGERRNISYSIEYQNIPNETAFFHHKVNGWKHIYSSYTTWQKWIIWAKAYEEGEEKPKLFNEKATHLKNAQKLAWTHTLMFAPLIFIFAYMVITDIIRLISSNSTFTTPNYLFLSVFLLVIIEFSYFLSCSWAYYFRVKKKYEP